jgi:hypothetical protein
LEGLDEQNIFSEKTRFLFWVTHEKIQKPENFCFLFPKVKWVKKISRKKFERARPEELRQFQFEWSYSLSLGNTRKI